MKTLPFYQVDAFTSEVFRGNPAAVVPLDSWLPDHQLQSIAEENNLSETAYICAEGSGYRLRWFTPVFEVDLCGHATLATAHVLFEHLGYDQPAITFHSALGDLIVVRTPTGYQMDFPIDQLRPFEIPLGLSDALYGANITHLYAGRHDWLAIVASQDEVQHLKPDMDWIERQDTRGIIVSAEADGELEADFVSRCFFPKAGIPEDPVTGSAHTTMMAHWAPALEKKQLKARQLSARSGDLSLELAEDRVLISGSAVTYAKGEIYIPKA